MKIKTVLILMVTLLLSVALLFAEEQAVNQTPATPLEGAAEEIALASDIEVQWLWGEVVSVDSQKNELRVRFVDYETDMEREVAVIVSNNTNYENVKSLLEIKPQDMVSIDYSVDSQGRNVARNISVEKPEAGKAE